MTLLRQPMLRSRAVCLPLACLSFLCIPIAFVWLTACADERTAHGGETAQGDKTTQAGQGGETAPLKIPKATGTPERLALLVGIGKYAEAPGCNVPDLPGPEHDLELVRALLIERFGFQKDDIFELRNEQATHQNIIDAFHRHLIQKADKDTQVVFWFSGHGSQIQDRSKREKDNLDSTLLAYDSRSTAPDGGFDITDDELHSLLEALPSNHITLVTDSCHSGDSFRNAGLPPRTVATGTKPLMDERVTRFWPKGIELLDDDDQRRRDISKSFVHVSACTASQLAYPWPVENPPGPIQHYGALTWFLCDALRRARKDTSWREVVRRVQLQLSNHRPGQTPVHDGDVERLVFGGGFKELPSGLPTQLLSASQLSIQAGTIHGLRQGSTVEIRSGSRKIGQARVTHVHPNGLRCIAEWMAPRPEDVSPTDLLEAVEISRPANLTSLRLYVGEPRLADRLSDHPLVTPVRSRAAADYQLDRDLDGSYRFRRGNLVLSEQGGDRLNLSMLTREFRKELRYQAVMRLPEEPGGLKITARFMEPRATELDGSAFNERWNYSKIPVRGVSDTQNQATKDQGHSYEAKAAGDGEYKRGPDGRPTGPLAIIEVSNESDQQVYVYVLSLEETRRVDLLWPWGERATQTLKKDQSLRVPIIMVANPEWTRQLRRPLRDRYVVIATTRTFDPRALINNGSFEPTRAPAVPPILMQALAADNDVRRGDESIPVGTLSWGSTWLDVHMAYEPRR